MNTSRRLHPATTLLLGLVTAATLAACGGSSGSDSAAPAGGAGNGSTSSSKADGGGSGGGAPDPCTLVSTSDLSAAYGVTFANGQPDTENVATAKGFKACKWSNSEGSASFVLQTVASGDPLGESASDLFDQSRGLYDGATDGGVGDKSILLKDDGGFLAVKGDVFVQGNPIIFSDKPAGSTRTVMTTVVGAL